MSTRFPSSSPMTSQTSGTASASSPASYLYVPNSTKSPSLAAAISVMVISLSNSGISGEVSSTTVCGPLSSGLSAGGLKKIATARQMATPTMMSINAIFKAGLFFFGFSSVSGSFAFVSDFFVSVISGSILISCTGACTVSGIKVISTVPVRPISSSATPFSSSAEPLRNLSIKSVTLFSSRSVNAKSPEISFALSPTDTVAVPFLPCSDSNSTETDAALFTKQTPQSNSVISPSLLQRACAASGILRVSSVYSPLERTSSALPLRNSTASQFSGTQSSVRLLKCVSGKPYTSLLFSGIYSILFVRFDIRLHLLIIVIHFYFNINIFSMQYIKYNFTFAKHFYETIS